MLTLAPTEAALLGLFCGFWLAAGLWATLRGLRRSAEAVAERREARSAEALLAAAPDLPLLVFRDGRVEAGERAGLALGLQARPERLDDIANALEEQDREPLLGGIAAAASTAGAFALSLRPAGSARVYRFRGGPAPASYPPGTVLLWLTDSTDSEEEMAGLR
ncbi:MAG TPA: histidine kinase, partial [Allosphingosinicella sp.]